MTKKDLIKIIREVVKREVKKEVQQIFIKENKSAENIELPKPKVSPKKHFTKNQALNNVLNETIGLTKKSDGDEYRTLGDGAFDTSRMTELMGYGKPEEVQRDMIAADSLKKAGKSVQDVPEAVTNALTRDYSDLMKVMNKKGK